MQIKCFITFALLQSALDTLAEKLLSVAYGYICLQMLNEILKCCPEMFITLGPEFLLVRDVYAGTV
jgi:hypothetical protein